MKTSVIRIIHPDNFFVDTLGPHFNELVLDLSNTTEETEFKIAIRKDDSTVTVDQLLETVVRLTAKIAELEKKNEN